MIATLLIWSDLLAYFGKHKPIFIRTGSICWWWCKDQFDSIIWLTCQLCMCHRQTDTMCSFNSSHLTLLSIRNPILLKKSPDHAQRQGCNYRWWSQLLLIGLSVPHKPHPRSNFGSADPFGLTWFWKWQIQLWMLHIFWYMGLPRPEVSCPNHESLELLIH